MPKPLKYKKHVSLILNEKIFKPNLTYIDHEPTPVTNVQNRIVDRRKGTSPITTLKLRL